MTVTHAHSLHTVGKTACGRSWVDPDQMAATADAATCGLCRRVLDRGDADPWEPPC